MRRRFLSILSFTFLFTTFSSQACGQAGAEFRDHPDIPKEWPREPVRAPHGMVATEEPLASQACPGVIHGRRHAPGSLQATARAPALFAPAARLIGQRSR